MLNKLAKFYSIDGPLGEGVVPVWIFTGVFAVAMVTAPALYVIRIWWNFWFP